MKKKLLAALLASALAAGMLPASACAASSSYTTANVTLIRFTDAAAKASGKYTGYEIDGTDVSITAAGTYVFSGDCDNGSITVKKGVTGVTIVLNGLTLTNDDSAAITLNKTAEASLIAAAGTTNTVADTEGSNDENAAVKVKSGAALAIGGTGTLTVDGNAKNGIKGAADAVITVAEVKLNINAANDGLSCDDELNITGGTLSITAGGMGGGPNGQGGGQGMTPPGDANGSNGNRPTPPNFSGNTSTDGTFTPPTKPSGGKADGKPSGNLPNRESALGIKEGSVITVQDSSGKTLCTATALGSMSSVIFSSADIREGETCTVLVDGASVGTATARLGTADSSSSMSTFEPGQGGQPNQNGSQITVGSFKDVPQNSWFASAVQYVTSSSLMNGTSATAFSPSATMSRGMLMTVLARYAGESTEGGTVWYEKGMNWAKNKGISDGSAPNRNITREQLAAMLYRYAGEPDGAADLSAYTDAGSVSAYAEKAVQWCVKNGILTGKTSSTLAPKATATRAECAAMLQRFASL